jgi:hypothetical protein
MKVPANITADRLMLEYLARVAAAGTRYLPKGNRMAFVSKTRQRIERECGSGIGDADCVRDVLARLGEPEELVKAERARIDAARIRPQASGAVVAEPAAERQAPGGAAGSAAGPTAGQAVGDAAGPAGDAGPAPEAPPADWGTPAAPGEPLEGKVLPPARAGNARAGEQPGAGTRPQAATAPPGWNTSPVRVYPRPLARRGTAVTALATAGHATAQLAWSGAAAARRYPREAVAIILLGFGGLILPFPFWLIGATAAIWSRIWDAFDKWVAFLGPLVFALLGSIVTAAVIHAQGNVVLVYSHALRVDIGYLLRAGSVLCAIFLAVRLRHGPRERIPPWRR